MYKVDYESPRGRKYRYLVENPDDEPTSSGILLGPPEGLVDELGLPQEIADRLHNQLFSREIFSMDDVQKKSVQLFAALQSALNLDVQRLAEAYHNYHSESA